MVLEILKYQHIKGNKKMEELAIKYEFTFKNGIVLIIENIASFSSSEDRTRLSIKTLDNRNYTIRTSEVIYSVYWN